MPERWFRQAVIYRLDGDTYQDSNGDGVAVRSAKRTASTAKRRSATRPAAARSGAKKAASTTRGTTKKATSTTS